MSQITGYTFSPRTYISIVLRCIEKFVHLNNGRKVELPQANDKQCTYEFDSTFDKIQNKRIILEYSQRSKSYKIVISCKLLLHTIPGGQSVLVETIQKLNEKAINQNTCYELIEPTIFAVKSIIEKESLIDKDNETSQYLDKLLNDINMHFRESLKKIVIIKEEKVANSIKEKQLYQILNLFKSNFDQKCHNKKKALQNYIIKNQNSLNPYIVQHIQNQEMLDQKLNKLSCYQDRVTELRIKRKQEKELNPLACKIIVKRCQIDNNWKPPESGFGHLQKVKAEYTILESFNAPSTEFIKKLKKEYFEKKSFKNTFIKKSCNKKENLSQTQNIIRLKSFETEIEVATIMRDVETEGIAEFFIEDARHPGNIIQNLYTKYYSQCLYEFRMSGKALIPIILLILEGLSTLNQFQILHRDLKPANVLLDAKKNPKIIDFGSSCSRNGCISKEKMNEKLYTTQYYNLRYEDIYKSEQMQITQQQFENHQLFDFYAFGRIVEKFSTDINVSSELGLNLTMNLNWLSKKCTNKNPNLRPNCQQTIFICTVLFKIWSLKKKVSI